MPIMPGLGNGELENEFEIDCPQQFEEFEFIDAPHINLIYGSNTKPGLDQHKRG